MVRGYKQKTIGQKIKLMTGSFLIASSLLCAGQMSTVAYAADGTSFVYEGYIYDDYGNTLESPAAFSYERQIDSSNLEGMSFQSVDDVCTSEDGRIFLTDKLSGRVNVFNEDGELLKSIKTIWNKEGTIQLDANGNQVTLQAPEGCYVHDKTGEIYIADPGGEQVVVLDLEDYSYIRVITRPDNMTGTTQFKPSKVAVDDANRIFLVVQSSYEGIIELASDGTFIGYYGVNNPKVNLVEYFWKSIATDEQKKQMSKTFAPAFNNIAVDGDGFVMAVTYDSAATDMIFRLNAKGSNVIREEGNTKLIGDLGEDQSAFVDIAVTDYGIYAVLDKTRGRVFIYDFDGELLNAFGSLGNLKGQLQTPTGIAWLGDKLIVTDSTLKCAYILTPSEFGQAIINGSREYYFGNWDEALTYFEQAVRLNSNYEVAYTGIGKNYLMKNEYESALYYFKQGNNRTYYSKAYYGYRGQQMKKHFGIIATVFVALIVLLFYSEIRYNRKNRRKA